MDFNQNNFAKITTGSVILAVVVVAFFWHVDAQAYFASSDSPRRIIRRSVLAFFTVLFVLSSIALYARYFIRRFQAEKAMKQAAEDDELWDGAALNIYIEEVFYEVMSACQQRCIESVTAVTTESFQKTFVNKYSEHKKGFMTEYIADYEFEGARMVAVSDFRDDKKDQFSVVILAKMRKFLVFEPENNVVAGEDKLLDFRELWHFKRYQSAWKLDKIDSDVSISIFKQLKTEVEANLSESSVNHQ